MNKLTKKVRCDHCKDMLQCKWNVDYNCKKFYKQIVQNGTKESQTEENIIKEMQVISILIIFQINKK